MHSDLTVFATLKNPEEPQSKRVYVQLLTACSLSVTVLVRAGII